MKFNKKNRINLEIPSSRENYHNRLRDQLGDTNKNLYSWLLQNLYMRKTKGVQKELEYLPNWQVTRLNRTSFKENKVKLRQEDQVNQITGL